MSRIDYITIAVVAICLTLLGIVFWKVADLNKADAEPLLLEEPLSETSEEPEPFVDGDVAISDFASLDTSSQIPEPVQQTDLSSQNGGSAVIDSSRRVKPVVLPRKVETGTNPENPVPGAAAEEYLVWGGTFTAKEAAEKEQARIRALGYRAAEVSLFDKGKYAVVIVGRFPTREGAEALAAELKSRHGINAIAKKKKL